MNKSKEPRTSRKHDRASGKHAGGEPSHGKKHLWIALFVAACLALFMQGVEYWGWFAGTEGRVLDLFLKWKPG